jgi:hypothetical protein
LLTINPASADAELPSSSSSTSYGPGAAHPEAVLDAGIDGGRTIGMEVFRLWMSHVLRSPVSKVIFVGSLGGASFSNSSFSSLAPRSLIADHLGDAAADSDNSSSYYLNCVVGGIALAIPRRTTQLVGLLNLVPLGVLVEKYKLPARICCSGGRGNDNSMTATARPPKSLFFDVGVFAGCPGFLCYLCNFVQELRSSSWSTQLLGASDAAHKTLAIEDPRVFDLFKEMAATLAAAASESDS